MGADVGFRTPLSMTQIAEAGEFMPAQFELDAPLVFDSRHLSHPVEVPTRFRTDLASVPRLPLVWMIAGGIGNQASVVHDYLYRERPDVARSVADAVFLEALLDTGVARWRAWAMYAAVRGFGRRKGE